LTSFVNFKSAKVTGKLPVSESVSQSSKGLPSFFFVIGPISLALNIISVRFEWSFWALLFCIFVPIVIYWIYVHFLYKDLARNPNIADSVYYLGFGATIITLATSSLVHFGSDHEFELKSLNLVFSQFAIGLIATCIGLILRLITIAKIDGSIVTADEEFKQRQDLSTAFHQLHHEISGFSQELQQINSDFRQQQLELQQATIQSLQTVREEALRDTRWAAEKAIGHIESATTQAIGQIGKAMLELTTQQQQVNQTLHDNMATLGQSTHHQLQSASEQMVTHTAQALSELVNKQHQLNTQAFQGLNALAQESHDMLATLNFKQLGHEIGTHAQQMAKHLGAFEQQFDYATSLVDKQNRHLEQQTTQSHQHVAQLNTVLGSLVESVGETCNQFNTYQSGLDGILSTLDHYNTNYKDHAHNTSQRLNELVQLNRQYNQEYSQYRQSFDHELQTVAATTKQTIGALTEIADHAGKRLGEVRCKVEKLS
jgi:hypothetical protein